MMEPTIRYGLQVGSLDIVVCPEGLLLMRHAHSKQEWEVQLMAVSRALAALTIWTIEDCERKRREQ